MGRRWSTMDLAVLPADENINVVFLTGSVARRGLFHGSAAYTRHEMC